MGRPSVIHEWFSIPETGQPLSYYDLLGLPILEDQPDAIEAAFRRRLQQLELHLNSEEQDKADRVFARLREARECLLDVKQKARYDAKIQAQARPQTEPNKPAPEKPPEAAAPTETPQRATHRLLYLGLAGLTAAMLLLSVGVAVVAVRMMRAIDDEAVALASVPTPSAPATASFAEAADAKPTGTESPPAVAPPEAEMPPAATPAKVATVPDTAESDESTATLPAALVEAKRPTSNDVEQEPTAAPAPPVSIASEPEVSPPPPSSPPPPPAIEDAEQRAEYIALAQEMLEKGLGKSPNRDQARISFEKARAICPSDPRLYYGYALILHTVQREEARKQLLAAMKQGAHPYPPAWRLLIDMEIKKGIDDRLIAGLPKFAERLEESQDPWPDATAKTEFAVFLGRVVGYCQGPGGARKRFEKELAAADESIVSVLQGANRKAYELGKLDIANQVESLEQNPKPRIDNEKAANEDRKLESEKQELKDNEQKLQRKKEEYDEKWNKMKVEFQRDITALEVDYKLHMENANAIQRGIAEITTSIEYTINAVKVLNPAQQAQIEGQKAQRSLLEIELGNALRQAYAVGLRAQARIAEIARAEADYQRATGQLVKESSFIADYRKSIQVQADRVAKQRLAKTKPESGSATVARFSRYAPLDIENEKSRVVLSYQASQ